MMRAALIVFVLAVLVAPVSTAQGVKWTEVATDPVDVALVINEDTPVTIPAHERLDLRTLLIRETETGFDVQIDLEDAGSLPPYPTSNHDVTMRFRHGAYWYIMQWWGGALPGPEPGAVLRGWDPDASRQWDVAELTYDFDATTYTFSTHIARELIPDEHGAFPLVGRTLEDITVEANAMRFITANNADGTSRNTIAMSDRMPDEGAATYHVLAAGSQGATARLSSPTPMRASNGEATTFVFHVTAENAGAEQQRFTLHADGVPDQWVVALPVPVLQLEPGGLRDVAALATVPFAHQHGVRETFELVMEGGPGDEARVTLGVDYLETPQPAGHHPTLYMHAAATDPDPLSVLYGDAAVRPYMNTLQDDPASVDGPIPAQGSGAIFFVGGETYVGAWNWFIPLSPGLRMGLDFDMDREGEYAFELDAGAAMAQGLLRFDLVYRTLDEMLLLHRVDRHLDGVATGRIDLEGTFAVPPEADLLPFVEHAGLEARITWFDTRPSIILGHEPPTMVPGARIDLPLLEYRDPIGEELDQGIRLDVGSPTTRAPPGGLARFDVQVVSQQRQDVVFTAHGAAATVSPHRADLHPDEPISVKVSIEVPKEAAADDLIDVVLDAVAEDGSGSGLVRLITIVDPDAESAHVMRAPSADSPLPWPLLVVALVVAGRQRASAPARCAMRPV